MFRELLVTVGDDYKWKVLPSGDQKWVLGGWPE